ncbi:toll-like receptor 6 [Leptopilina heterotoma]|uniref:toll-like receptor 6 n=1 Tax=Leptopilina heterotoma TaxID=63436 RepID=UPI001CA9F0B9|nr:toll-like receptor 6 [Leptopilina heterotoma]
MREDGVFLVAGVFFLFLMCHALAISSSTPSNKFQLPEYCAWIPRIEGAINCIFHSPRNHSLRMNFTQIASDYVTTLNIACETFMPQEAEDDDEEDEEKPETNVDEFLRLWKLRSLRITGCDFTNWSQNAFARYRDLRNLTIIHSHLKYSIHGYQLDKHSFKSIPQIEIIDISSNRLEKLNSDTFCSLTNLVVLNISRNNFPTIQNLGISDCSLDIKTLDLSHNLIKTLPVNAFSKLKRLNVLDLSENEINVIVDRAFHGLRSLRTLDLSNNRISTLPAQVFKEMVNSLKELKMGNNSISYVPNGLVANMNQLVALDLSNNLLTNNGIESSAFSGLIRLVLLDLSNNKIGKLDSGLFRDLYTLQILNLRYNDIGGIPSETFSAMSNLHSLEISHNRLEYLDAHSLSGLFALSLLNMDFNLLEDIHPDAFRNCSSIQDLHLSGNMFQSVPLALKDMRLLRTLDLGENSIRQLEKFNLEGMANLYGLRLMGNEIVNVSQEALVELPALQILNLAKNKIVFVEDEAFGSNPALQAVRLDGNFLQDIRKSFLNATNLLWLNISDNLVESFEYDFFPERLQWLDLHKNLLTKLGKAQVSHLQTLDLSFNKLTRIQKTNLPTSLELVFLNDNLITSIGAQTFFAMENLTRVDLYSNQIVRLELSAFQLGKTRERVPEFYIGGNPFICDCTTEWLQRINQFNLGQHPKVMDLELVYCKLPYDRRQSFISLLDAKPSQFLCSYNTHCFALCHCCEFDACDCEMTCPMNCSCYHDESWSANVVDCSNSAYQIIPGRVPMDATEVYLDGNNFGELNSHSFIGRKNLEILYANNSNIEVISNNTFSGLKRLVTLHLEHNCLRNFYSAVLVPIENLKELYLQYNFLEYLDEATFKTLRHLEVLHLNNNHLKNFALWQLGGNPYLVDLMLSGNPWNCDCNYVDRAGNWMFQNKEKISDWRQITCSLGIPMITLVNGSVVYCAALTNTSSTIKVRPFGAYMPLILAIGVLALIIIALICGVLRHNRVIRAWTTNRYRFRTCYKTAAFEDRQKPFDACISYSAIDEQFVSGVLVPGLESTYRLCLHYRDLADGNNGMMSAIAEAAESSRRTILVLSDNFLQSEWMNCEFKIALREAIKRKESSIILLLVGDECPRDLDRELKKIISSHTVLVWGEKLFWRKLRFAMPDVLTIPALERPPLLPTPPPPPQIRWA